MRLSMLLVGVPVALVLSGCFFGEHSYSRMQAQNRLWQELAGNPDVAVWQEQRGKIVQSLGDRVFDEPFEQVFDAVVAGLGTLEVTVENMERESGYIVVHGNPLPTARKTELKREKLKAYCRAKGHDPDLVEQREGDFFDVESMAGMMKQYPVSLTFSVVRQDRDRTKVKLRIAQVFYPPALQEVYQITWRAVDKQIFLDEHLD